MKKRSIVYLYQMVAIVVIAIAITSCSDEFFTEKTGERITPEQHYKSMIDAQVSLYGAFAPLSDVVPQMIMVDGLRSDQMIPGPGADQYLSSINWQVFTPDNPFIDPSAFYKVIINCNEVLANIEKVNELDRNFTPFMLKSWQGALITLRGWSYYTLVSLYGSAAWIEGSYTSLPADRQQQFITKDVMIDTLINQLSKYVYDPTLGREYSEVNFSPIMNTKAVLGDLYLEKGDYVNAAKYYKLACESYLNQADLYKVSKAYTKEAWKNIFIGAEYQENENISYVTYNLYEGQVNPLPRWMMGSDLYMVKPAQAIVDSFKVQVQANKKIGDLFRGQGITYDTISTGEAFISKYSLDKGQEFSTDVIISRAADLHLKLAEALNRTGKAEDEYNALVLLNSGFANEKNKPAAYAKWAGNLGVRGRAYLDPKLVPDSVMHVAGGDTTMVKLEGIDRTEYIEDMIMDERALELAFEGYRFADLVRVANRRDDPAYLADKVASKYSDPFMAEEVRIKLMNPANWYLPYKK